MKSSRSHKRDLRMDLCLMASCIVIAIYCSALGQGVSGGPIPHGNHSLPSELTTPTQSADGGNAPRSQSFSVFNFRLTPAPNQAPYILMRGQRPEGSKPKKPRKWTRNKGSPNIRGVSGTTPMSN